MLRIFKTTDSGLTEIDEIVNNCWVNLVDPTTDEIERVKAEGVPGDFLTYALDMDERARTEREDDGTQLIILRIPYYEGDKVDIPFVTIPLSIIITNAFIVTICRRQNDILTDFAGGKVRGLATAKRYRFVLRLLFATANYYLSYLREINRRVEATEDKLQISMKNSEVLELLKYQKSLVYFTTALKGNELMVERLKRAQMFSKFPDDEDLLEDVMIENQQAIEMVNISTSILNGLMDAFASIISNNLNVVMKFLASITIVLNIPTIITGFFGMNVDIPGAGHPTAYAAILASLLVISMIVVFIFNKRNWF